MVELMNGWAFNSDRFSSSVGVPLVRIRDLVRGRTETFYDGPVADDVLVDDGDLLVGMDGDFNSVVWRGGRAALNQRLCRLRAVGPLTHDFLRYVIDLPLRYINDLTYATTVKHLSSIDLLNERIPLPAPTLQRTITSFLDTEATRIDALMAKKRRMIDLLDEADTAMVDAVFGPRADEMTVRLARLARLQTGLTLDGGRSTAEVDVTLPYLRVANVQAGYLDLEDMKTVTVSGSLARRCRLREGDVLMTEGGDLDKLGRGTVWNGEISECLHQNHVFAVRTMRDLLLPAYLAELTRTSHAREYFESTGSRSTNLASTNSSKVLDLRIPVLDVGEQERRLGMYRSKRTPIDGCRAALGRQIRLLQEHRQALITAAVTGEIEVPGVAA